MLANGSSRSFADFFQESAGLSSPFIKEESGVTELNTHRSNSCCRGCCCDHEIHDTIQVRLCTPSGCKWVALRARSILTPLPGLVVTRNGVLVRERVELHDEDVVRVFALGLGGKRKKGKKTPPPTGGAESGAKKPKKKRPKSFGKGTVVRATIVGKGGYMSNIMGAVRNYLQNNPQALGNVGEMIGNRFGISGAGQILGDHAQKLLMRKLKGSGDYTSNLDDLHVNSLIKGGIDENMSFGNSGDYVRIKHREYLGDLITGDSGTFTLAPVNGFPINPGLTESFPYLAQMAPMFQEYKIHGLVYETVPTTSPYNSNSAMGEVIISAQYNVGEPPFSSKQQMLNSGYAVSARLDKPVMYGFECESPPYQQYMVRTGPSDVPLNLTDLGTVYFATATASTFPANSVIAEIWVTYDIVLSKPFFPRPVLGYAILNQTYTQSLQNSDNTTLPLGEYNAFAGAPVNFNSAYLTTNRYISVGRCTRDGYKYDNVGVNSPFAFGTDQSLAPNSPSLSYNNNVGQGLAVTFAGAEVGDLFHVHVYASSAAALFTVVQQSFYSSISIVPSAHCVLYNATEGAPMFVGSSGTACTAISAGSMNAEPNGPLFPMTGGNVFPEMVTSSTSTQTYSRTTGGYGTMGGYVQGGDLSVFDGEINTALGPQDTFCWVVGVVQCSEPSTSGSPMTFTIGYPVSTGIPVGSYQPYTAYPQSTPAITHNVHIEVSYIGKTAQLNLSKTLGTNLASYTNPACPPLPSGGCRSEDGRAFRQESDDISIISNSSSRGRRDFHKRTC